MRNKANHKILFLDQAKEIGGAELSLISVAKNIQGSTIGVFEKGLFFHRLKNESIEAKIIGINGNILSFSKEKSELWKLFKAIPILISAMFKIAALMKKYEIVCFNTQKALVLGVLPAKLLRKKTIFFLRDIVSQDHFGNTNIRIIKFCANLCDKIICNSNATKDAFILSGGNSDISVTIYNGIEPLPFQNIEPEKSRKLKTKLGLNGMFVVGSFSRIAEWKGQHVLIEAMKDLPDNFHCLIVGSPFFNEDIYYLKLKKMVKKLGLSARVHFLSFTDDIATLMKICNLIAHTSVAPEPFGRVIVEAMMAVRPIIATNMGGAKEIIDNNVNGFLIESDNHKKLAEKILYVQKNKKIIDQIIQTANSYAIKKFSERIMIRKVKSVIEKI